MSNLFSDIQTELKYLIDCYIEQKKKSLSGTQFPHTYMIEPRSQTTYCLEPETIYTYLEIAIEMQHPLLNTRTFYLQDLSDDQQTPYNSLIFDINGGCFKSKDTTSQIIDRFATYKEKPYNLTEVVGQLIGMKQECPYVVGDLFFAPVCETHNNKTNWLGLHHVVDTKSHAENTHFFIKNNHELTLPLNKSAVDSIVVDTYLLYYSEQIFIYHALKNYNRHHSVLLN